MSAEDLAAAWEAGYRAASRKNFPDYDEPAGFSRPWTEGQEENPYIDHKSL